MSFSSDTAKEDVSEAINKVIKHLFDSIKSLAFDIDLRKFKFEKDKKLIRDSKKKLEDVHSKLRIFKRNRVL